MTTTIDFDALQVSEGPRVTLLGNQEVGGGLVGDDFADFSAFASLSVDAKVQRKAVRAPSPSLTVLIEHSDDGLSWSTAETFTFTDDGEQTASVASPKAHVRASASGSGAEWYVKSVEVAPISGGGGGSMPGIPLAAGPAWAPGVPVTEGYQITASYLGQSRAWEATSSGTTSDDGSVFPDDYSPSLDPLAETNDNDFSWRYLGIVGEISYQYLPVAGLAVVESGYYEQSIPTTVPNGGNAILSFDDFAGGDDVLDITDPTQPLVRKAGLFTVSVEVSPTTNMTAGGTFGLTLTLDLGGEAIEMRNGAVADQGICEVSNSWVLAAGEQLRLSCANFDGVQDRAFNINNATVCRVGPA